MCQEKAWPSKAMFKDTIKAMKTYSGSTDNPVLRPEVGPLSGQEVWRQGGSHPAQGIIDMAVWGSL
jgi:hypothetical protein